jgi:hypothetical protein
MLMILGSAIDFRLQKMKAEMRYFECNLRLIRIGAIHALPVKIFTRIPFPPKDINSILSIIANNLQEMSLRLSGSSGVKRRMMQISGFAFTYELSQDDEDLKWMNMQGEEIICTREMLIVHAEKDEIGARSYLPEIKCEYTIEEFFAPRSPKS